MEHIILSLLLLKGMTIYEIRTYIQQNLSTVCSDSLGSIQVAIRKLLDKRYIDVKEYIDNNKQRIINCEDVAKECFLSAKQLNRVFKNSTGITVFEYIVASKIKYAKQFL